MIVRALFFARYRDLAGAESLDVELPAGARAGDLVERLRTTAALRDLPARPALAVNLEYVPLSTVLSNGDEVAFIPPVAGG